MAASLGVQMASATETDYPDMEVGVFWNSDSDRSDTVYMSYNGADFQQSARYIRPMAMAARTFPASQAMLITSEFLRTFGFVLR